MANASLNVETPNRLEYQTDGIWRMWLGLVNSPDAKLAVACSGDERRIAKDFSAACEVVYAMYLNDLFSEEAYLANIRVLPPSLAGQ